MKKKIIYVSTFIAATATTFALVWGHPGLLFEGGHVLVWDIFRTFLVGIMVAMLVTGTLFIIMDKDNVIPYVMRLVKFRSLLYQLVRRDFLSKYKRSVLGVLWSLLSPLFTMVILTIVFSTLFRFDIENYPVYLLSGQIVFNTFSEITNTSMNSILEASALIKKVSLPKYIFPLSKAISGMVNFACSLLALLLVMLFTGAPFHPQLLLMPIPALYLFVFSTGVGMLLASVRVFFRDISYLYSVFMTALMYLTPIFYPLSIIPEKLRFIVSMNPMQHYVKCFRAIVIYGEFPSLWQHVICLLFAVLSVGVGFFSFYRNQHKFILYV